MDRIHLPNDLVIQLFKLYESSGQSYYYKQLFTRDDDVMARNTLETDVNAIAYYLDLNLTPARIKLLKDLKKDYVTKNKDETLLINIKETLSLIQSLGDTFELTLNEVLDLSVTLFRDYKDIKLKTNPKAKSTKLAKEFEDFSTEEQLIRLVKQFNVAKKTNRYEIIQLITNFYVDFIKLDLFTDKNELIALIIVYTMVSKEFRVCRYESFFDKLLPKKQQLETAYIQAGYNWFDGYAQTESLSRVFVTILHEMHEDVKIKAHEYEFERKMNKTDSIENTILKGPSVFSKNDLRENHPYSSDATINRTLISMKERELIRPLGSGRSAKWQRLTDKKEEFRITQLDMFNLE